MKVHSARRKLTKLTKPINEKKKGKREKAWCKKQEACVMETKQRINVED